MKRKAQIQNLSELDTKYQNVRRRYRQAVDSAVSYSVTVGGTPSNHGREYWSSILFTKLCLAAITVDRMAPHVPSNQGKDLWDLASTATLVRAIAENYLLLYWLCTQTTDQELWLFRFTLLRVVDNRSRYRMAHELKNTPEPDDFIQAQMSLAITLQNMPMFTSLPTKRQRELLRGDRLPFIQDEVIDSLSIDITAFRRFYRYLSTFVHTGTISFFRMEEHTRGNGEKNEYELGAIGGCLELAIIVLDAAVRDMTAIGQPTASAN